MELLASEPLVTDPVDMAYDEDGLAYVAEMRGYPFPASQRRTPDGRIRVLWDEDGDGIFDHSRIFCAGLHWPTSVAVWRGGVYVLAPPNLWYLKDTDGDRVADVKQLVCRGFGTYNVQAVANNLKWGLDGRFYGAGSGNGGTLEFRGRKLTLRRKDFSFDPFSGEFRVETGAGRFGNAFDDWGNRFICNIRNPVLHVVIDHRYLARNPVTALQSGLTDVAEAGDQVPVYPIARPEPWRLLRARQWAVDPRGIPRSELVGIGFFTSACGVTVYRGDAYPESMRGEVFVAEVANNLIHRRRLLPHGVSFRSERVDRGCEIVASSDNWFRPVNFVNAPDGTLHVLDMYREVIEHPWSIPDELLAKLDLVSGVEKGRIYRLRPSRLPRRARPQLSRAPTRELVRLLEHPAAWWSETAQRLLIERQDHSAYEPLLELLKNSTVPRARAVALWTLERLGRLAHEHLIHALEDPNARVREQAVRIAETRLSHPDVLSAVVRLSNDQDLRVRFRVALALGELTVADRAVTEALVALALADGVNHWMAVAIASSTRQVAVQVTTQLLQRLPRAKIAAYSELLELLLATIGREEPPERVATVLEAFESVDARTRLRLASAAIAQLRRRGVLRSTSLQRQRVRLLELARRLLQRHSDIAARRTALETLRTLGHYAEVRSTLLGLARSRDPDQAQEAVRTIGLFSDAAAGRDLLRLWYEADSERMRTDIMLQLLRRTTWIELVFDEIEAGSLPPLAVPAQRRWLLTEHPSARISERARRLFGTDVQQRTTPESVRAAVRKVLALRGDPARGRELFQRECAACHRLAGLGNAIGPDLASLQRRGPEDMLLQIIDPNREIAPEFVQYAILLNDGRSLTGAIEQETGEALRVILQDGSKQEIERRDVDQIRALGISLMPAGFAEKLSAQQLADVVAFVLHASSTDVPRASNTRQ